MTAAKVGGPPMAKPRHHRLPLQDRDWHRPAHQRIGMPMHECPRPAFLQVCVTRHTIGAGLKPPHFS